MTESAKIVTMNHPYLLIGLLTSLFGLYVWIGKKASSGLKNNDDYFLMGRTLTFFPLAMTLFATMLGGGVLVGAAQAAHTKGWSVIVYPLGTLLGFVGLGLGFGAKLRRLNIQTIAEIFEHKYGSKRLRNIAALISIFSLYAILVAQGIAIKSLFVSIGITNPLVFFLSWGAFVGYTTMGGFKAVVDTDVIQAIVILVGLIAAALSLSLDDVEALLSATPSLQVSHIPWSSWLLMPLCFILIGQDMGQRCFASKNPNLIAPAALLAGLLLILCSGIAIVFGLLAKMHGLEIAPGANILLAAVQALTSPLVMTLFAASIIMAIASTADSLLCSISSNICSDFSFIQSFSSTKQLRIAKITTFVLGVSAFLFIIFFDDVVDALMFSYELSVSSLFVPIVMGVLIERSPKHAAIASMLVGTFGFVLLRLSPLNGSREWITICLSLLIYVMIWLWKKARNRSH